MITLLRTMTLKSPMKFGKWYDLTVGDIINSKGYYGIDYLVWVYYSASKISFNDEVLNILGIIDESQLIEKPGNLKDSKALQKIATDFVKKREHADWFHGPDGMGNMNYPAPKLQETNEDFIEVLNNHINQHPDEITLVTLGPLTNVANFIKKYPNNASKSEIEKLLIDSYISSKNYQLAIDFLENNLSFQNKSAYQKVCFYRGLELFNEGRYSAAIQVFEKSLEEPSDSIFKARAIYWKAESYYRLNKFPEAVDTYLDYISEPGAIGKSELSAANYNIGYAYYKLKDYPNSILWFRKFVTFKPMANAKKINDALKALKPIIIYPKGCWHAINSYSKIGASGLGIDWSCSARNARYLSGNNITLQGNMDPSRLFSPKNELIKLTKKMLNEFGNQKYIANLGHGILPNTPVDNVKVFVDTIKSFSND